MNAFLIVALVAGVVLTLGLSFVAAMADDTNDGDIGKGIIAMLVAMIGAVVLVLDGIAYLVSHLAFV